MSRNFSSRKNAAALYDQFCFGRFCYGNQREAYYPYLFEFLAPISLEDTVTEVGCGEGYWHDAFYRNGVLEENLLCIDISQRNIKELLSKGVPSILCDAVDLAIRNHHSTYTICSGVLHHTWDPLRAFKGTGSCDQAGRADLPQCLQQMESLLLFPAQSNFSIPIYVLEGEQASRGCPFLACQGRVPAPGLLGYGQVSE